jgi:hypothetical protein
LTDVVASVALNESTENQSEPVLCVVSAIAIAAPETQQIAAAAETSSTPGMVLESPAVAVRFTRNLESGNKLASASLSRKLISRRVPDDLDGPM